MITRMRKQMLCIGMVGATILSLTACGRMKSPYLVDADYTDFVELCEYENVEATKVIFEVTDKDVDQEIQSAIYAATTYDVISNRGIKKDDYVNISYKGEINDFPSDSYSKDNYDCQIGEKLLLDGMEDELIGMKTGETKEFDLTLSKKDALIEEDEGKTLHVTVVVNSVRVENMPKYDDEFIAKHTQYHSKESYEESLKQKIKDSKEEEYKNVAADEILTYIMKESTFNEYPEELYTQCEDSFKKTYQMYADLNKMELDEFLESIDITKEKKNEIIMNNVNSHLVVGAIAQAEKINCTEEELNNYVDDNYELYGYKSAEAFLNVYPKEEIGYDIIYRKVREFLCEKAKYNEVDEKTYIEQQTALSGTDNSEVEQ